MHQQRVHCFGAAHLSTKSMLISEGVYGRSAPGLVEEGSFADLRAPHTAAKPSIRETPGKQIKYCMHRLSAERWDESYYYPWLRTVDNRWASCCLSYRISDSIKRRIAASVSARVCLKARSQISYQQHFTGKTWHMHLNVDAMHCDTMIVSLSPPDTCTPYTSSAHISCIA